MIILRKQIYATLLAFSIFKFYAQVPKRVVVEHFTNSVCGTCANRNPAFFSNLGAQDSVLHLAIHPSSPYATCAFNTHNVNENDGRTNFYGIFGSTPRLVIQGTAISAVANYGDAAIFAPFINQTSPASIIMRQFKVGSDSVKSVVVVKTEAAHTLSNLKLFVALVENPVLYNAPNGENFHRNVFRKAVTTVTGDVFTLPAIIGDSVVFSKTSLISPVWNFNAIHSLAILQESGNNSVVQSAVSKPGDGTPMGIGKIEKPKAFEIYPNPANEFLILKNNTGEKAVFTIFNAMGKLVFSDSFLNDYNFTTTDLTSGLYFVSIQKNTKNYSYKFIKNN